MRGAYTSKARSWSNSPPHAADGRQPGHGGCLCSQDGEGEVPGCRRNWCQVGSSVARETNRGACPSIPVWQAIMVEMFRTTTSWGRGKYVGRSVIWVGCSVCIMEYYLAIKRSIVICNNMNGSIGYYTKWNVCMCVLSCYVGSDS